MWWNIFIAIMSSGRVIYRVYAWFSADGGYNPNDENSDQGASMLTALNYWRNVGIIVQGERHKIGGYVSINATDLDEVRSAIWMFGNLFTGVQLPVSVQAADDWTVPDGGIYGPAGQVGGWGGHCIPTMAESPETLTCVTWGERLKMSHNFLLDYADECYAVLSADWLNSVGKAPAGFDLAALKRDIALLPPLIAHHSHGTVASELCNRGRGGTR